MRIVFGLFVLCALGGCAAPGGSGAPAGGDSGPIVWVEGLRYSRRLDQMQATMAARRSAYGAMQNRGTNDYRRGFTRAYIDVAEGRTGTAPPVPPQRYWSAGFRNECGDARVEEWYSGYRDGIASARACGNQDPPQVSSSGTGYHHGPMMSGSGDMAGHAVYSAHDPLSPCSCRY